MTTVPQVGSTKINNVVMTVVDEGGVSAGSDYKAKRAGELDQFYDALYDSNHWANQVGLQDNRLVGFTLGVIATVGAGVYVAGSAIRHLPIAGVYGLLDRHFN
jgi:hypothetical protein